MKTLHARPKPGRLTGQFAILTLLASPLLPLGATAAVTAPVAPPAAMAVQAYAESAEIGPTMSLVIGKSTLLRLPSPIDRISVGNPNVADVTLISARELYLLGKSVGATNVILWRKGGATTIVDVSVNVDAARLETRIHELLPDETKIRVTTAAESIVLTGEVSSAERAADAVMIAEAYVRNLNRGLVMPVVAGSGEVAAGTTIRVGESRSVGSAVRAAGSQVVNMLRIGAPQQVMLEVKVAEVSKTLLEKIGVGLSHSRKTDGVVYSVVSDFLTGGNGIVDIVRRSKPDMVTLDAQKDDGLVKVLAEPNVMAISGQEGSFLSGGKIFIPVEHSTSSGGTKITLEEKEFGVALKFTPTVLSGGRINLKVAPEVSELNREGIGISAPGVTGAAILPSFTTRRAETTVQLLDGQSFAIGGLIKNNVTTNIKAFPFLGEIPVLGALFRSSDFQTDRSELVFVITPRLVKPLPENYALPTDNYIPPTRANVFLEGKLEGSPTLEGVRQIPDSAPSGGGFENQ